MAVDYEAAWRIVGQYVSDVRAALPIDKVYLYGLLRKRYCPMGQRCGYMLFFKQFCRTEYHGCNQPAF